MAERFHIITGGPGSGKSSLITALSVAGYAHMPEAGRAIIQHQVSTGGTALPWADRGAFARLMLARDLQSYRQAAMRPGPVIFDRGIPDVIGYLRLCNLPVPPEMMRAAQTRRYSRHVFIAPHWPDIYAQDPERKQSAAEAEATFHAMIDVYCDLGYEMIELPLASIEQRVDFIAAHIGATQHQTRSPGSTP